MKIIFLDFDGVLNSATSFLYEHNRRVRHKEQGVKGPVNQTLSLHCCAAFQEVLNQYPEAKVVISSTWRTMFDLGWLQAKLAEYHIDSSRVIGCTPEDRWNGNRGHEIRWWLDKNAETLGVTHYVIIDDNDWGIVAEHGPLRFVQTDWPRGMGVEHTAELCDKLSTKSKEKALEWDIQRAAEIEKIKKEIEERKNNPEEPDNNF